MFNKISLIISTLAFIVYTLLCITISAKTTGGISIVFFMLGVICFIFFSIFLYKLINLFK